MNNNKLPDKEWLYNTIIGELNRISVSDDIKEVLNMADYLRRHSEQYVKVCLIDNFGKQSKG